MATRGLRSAFDTLLKQLQPAAIGQLLPRASATSLGKNKQAPLRMLDYEKQLPEGLPRAKDEFKNIDATNIYERGMFTSLEAQRFMRVSLSMYESVELRETVVGLGAAVAAVYGIGLAESLTVLSGDFCGDSPLHAARFAHQYAFEQILPSAICMPAKPAAAVALFLGHDPTAALAAPFCSAGTVPYDYSHVCSPSEAGLVLRQQGLAATRCTLATLAVLTMMLRTVTLSLRTAQELRERVRVGQEPLFRGVSQRVIRLCGRTSDVTSLSLSRYGAHIVPVFEEPEAVRALISEHSRSFQRPVFWHVAEGSYSQMSSWSRFRISSDMFLRTTTGRRLLYLEADTTNHERSLSLSARSTDLTMEDASQGFRLIEAAARRMLDDGATLSTPPPPASGGIGGGKPSSSSSSRPMMRTMRVVLGDPRQCESAKTTARRRDLRTRIRKLGEADVLIDSQASVLEAVLRWCAHVGSPPRRVDEPLALMSDAHREAAHAAAEVVAEQAEEAAEAAVAQARKKSAAAAKAAVVAEEEETLAVAAVAEHKDLSRFAAPGRASGAADAAVSAVEASRNAAKAAVDAEEAELLAAIAGAGEAAAWVSAAMLPERTIVFETDSKAYGAEVQAVLRRFDVAVIEEEEAERLEEELAEATREAASAYSEAAQALVAARERVASKAAAGEPVTGGPSGGEADGRLPKAERAKLARLAEIEERLDHVESWSANAAPSHAHAQLPRLVYLSSTSETANAVQSLVRAGVADPARCCAILDKHDGVHMLRALMPLATRRKAAAAGEPDRPLVEVVDCSVIYDDLLRQVRVWSRLGHSASEIQHELDTRFLPISEVLDRAVASE